MQFSPLTTLLTFLIVLFLLVDNSSTLPLVEDVSSTSLNPRWAKYTLRNMNLCLFSFEQNQCTIGTVYSQNAQRSDIYLFDHNCNEFEYRHQVAGNGAEYTLTSRLPFEVFITVSEWSPTFTYAGVAYNSPTCVADDNGDGSGCKQTFPC